MASHPSMMPEHDLRLRSHDELVAVVRRLESDKLSLISEHSAVMHEVNRRLHTHLFEIRALRDANLKAETEMHLLRTESAQRARASAESRLAAERSAAELQQLRESAERSADEIRRLHESIEQSTAETRELRELCCFLDDDRKRLRRLADRWQEHGQHVTNVTLDDQGCANFAALASELEQKQNAIVKENAQLRELCLFLDDERNAVLAGGSAAGRAPAVEAPAATAAAAAAATALDNTSLSRVEPDTGAADRRRGLGDGASSLPAASIQPATVTASQSDVEPNGGDVAARYIKALEAKVRSLELERNKYKKILEISESVERLPNGAAPEETETPAKSLGAHVPATSSALLNGLPLMTGRSVPLEKAGIWKDIQQSEKAIVKELCNVLWRKLGNGEASFPSAGASIDLQGGSLAGFDRRGPQGSSSVPAAAEGFASVGDDSHLAVPFATSVALTNRNVRVAAGGVSDQSQAVPGVCGPVRQLPSQSSRAFVSAVGVTHPASNESVTCDSSSAVLRAPSSGQPPPPAAAAAQATQAAAAPLPQLHVPAAAAPSRANDANSAASGSSSHRVASRPGHSSEPASRSSANSTDRYTSFVVTGNALLPNGGDRLQVHRLVDSTSRSASGADASKNESSSEAPGSGTVVGRVSLADISGPLARLPPSHHLHEGRPAPADGGDVAAVRPAGPSEYAATSGRVPLLGDLSSAVFVGRSDREATSRGLGDPGVTRRDLATAGRADVVHAQQQQRSGASSRSGSVSSTGSWPAVAAASAAVLSSGAGGGRRLLGGSDSAVLLQPSATVASQQQVATANGPVSVRAGSAASPSGSSSSSGTERLGSQRLATRVPPARPFAQQPPQPEQPLPQQQPSVQKMPIVGGTSQAPHLRVQNYYGDAHQLL